MPTAAGRQRLLVLVAITVFLASSWLVFPPTTMDTSSYMPTLFSRLQAGLQAAAR